MRMALDSVKCLGPMPLAASGIFSLGPLANGFPWSPRAASARRAGRVDNPALWSARRCSATEESSGQAWIRPGHIKSRADWYRALAYIKPSGANLFTHENRLPKRCSPGCVCNTQIFAQHGYTPSGLYAFYQAQTALLAAEFPNKTISYALIQEGFPLVSNAGAYEQSDGTSSGGPLPEGTEQTQTIIDNGQAAYGLSYAVQH
jgi:hypothetical protein